VQNFSEKANFIWSVADLIRDTFKRGKYQDVILPFTVLRRLDAVLEPTKDEVIKQYNKYKDKLDNIDPLLRKASGYAFYNTSQYTFDRLLDDSVNLGANLRNYINSFSENMRDVLEKFNFEHTISRLEESGLLFMVMERFNNIDLHPDIVSNLEMGYIFEELIRRFNEALNENPGEHFTPREIIRLMVNLLLSQDQEALSEGHVIRTVYDPCCGSGGMLTITKERILELNPLADVHLFGQEVNPETYAVSKSDMYMISADGRDAENIKFGTTLSKPQHLGMHFNYVLANPPYGKDWKMDKVAVEREAKRGHAGRFGAGTPRVSDGQLLFLQHMISHRKAIEEGGTRIAIVMNGSPLFTGDAGSGESEIRRWMLENDWVEAIIALPEQLFYNTGIATYVWILSNRKESRRQGKVQLIDATSFWEPMRKSLGAKRREISDEQIQGITAIYQSFEESDKSKIFNSTDFGFRKIRVELPLCLNFQASPERIEHIKDDKNFKNLARSKKKQPEAKTLEEQAGREQQKAILDFLEKLPNDLYKDRNEFEKIFNQQLKENGLNLSSQLRKAIFSALSERDEEAMACVDKKGNPEADSDLRDYENVPLGEDIQEYFDREVTPYVPDAWIDEKYTDDKDDEVGRVGYEINFNRYFYVYEPPRPLEEIEAEIKKLTEDIIDLMGEVTG
jgi:type I restriction enzyme M protein